jgi:hypothetical protein
VLSPFLALCFLPQPHSLPGVPFLSSPWRSSTHRYPKLLFVYSSAALSVSSTFDATGSWL